MFAALLARFSSREAVTATAAQVALTWASNHLAASVAALAEAADGLAADVERLTSERDEALVVVGELEDHVAELRAALVHLDLDRAEAIEAARSAAKAKHPARAHYPDADDVDPLHRADGAA
jgi:SpoU rRNA methylase family enzyme